MKRHVFTMLLLLVPAAARAQQQPTPEQMKAMVEKMQPGTEHKVLAALEGRWTQEITYSMGTPQPMKATGTVTNRLILGGRFLQSEGVSDNPAGPMFGDAKVEFLSLYGFDRRTNQYTIVGLDSMGTYWVTAAGVMKPGRTILMSGETEDDHSGTKEVRKYDMVLRFVDANTYVTEIIFKFPNRPDLKVVEVLHRRIK